MPSIPLLRTRTRALLFISLFVATLALTSRWKVSQRASIRSNHPAGGSSPGQFFPGTGGITPLAASITVNSNAHAVNGTDGLCTLREAIIAANTDAASGATAGECAAGSGADTIDLTTVSGTITLTSELLLSTNITLNGPGASALTISGGNVNRVLNIDAGGTVAISDL